MRSASIFYHNGILGLFAPSILLHWCYKGFSLLGIEMMLRVLFLALILSTTALLATETLAVNKQAQKQKSQQEVKKHISSKQAAKLVQRQYGGKVLKVNKQKNNASYKVKIVRPNGQVISKKVNAKTGKIEKH
ncbi:PepSY domain-containing protein [Colwellia piezophila]|uniref:PepSY domain-containing protein n=1 Tax=Colwellia piezophila TaxID=211668 RepID=UPI000382348C|nr:PepSY domain-containing protein [Colwellia piezophila]